MRGSQSAPKGIGARVHQYHHAIRDILKQGKAKSARPGAQINPDTTALDAAECNHILGNGWVIVRQRPGHLPFSQG